MSTILDAIRKAEQQRQDESVPTLESIISDRRKARAQRNRSWVIWVLLLVVLVAAAVLYRQQIGGWGQQGLQVAQHWVGQSMLVVRGLLDRDDQQVHAPVAGTTTQTEQATTANPVPATAEPSASAPDTATQEQVGQQGAQQPSQLTNAQRELLQQIRFTVISYSSDKNKRFAMVGSQTLREGDLLEGFPIIRIQKDGVMVDVNGRAVLIRL